ncbi:hypothetical protein [Streptomyces sp. NPDC048438]|uniref:hypothetical protein n=1 Tax=Streptomyces sp. NPDC048438 TaxID=3365551 RepID=UPI0037236FFA
MGGGDAVRAPGRADTGERGAGIVIPAPADSSLLTLLGLEEAEDVVYRLLVDRPDGEQDVLLRKADGTTVEVTPEAGTTASRLAMKHGRIAWTGNGGYVHLYDIESATTQSKRIGGWIFNSVSDIQLTSDRIYWRETGGLLPSTAFMSAPLDDLSQAAKLRYPTGTYVAQFSVNEEYFAYSTYDIWGGLGSWTGPGKVKVSTTVDVLAGLNNFSRVSCSSGAQLAPSLGDGRRVAWLDTTAAATDVATRATFAGSCEE